MYKFRNFLALYFSLSRKESNGLLILFPLIFIMLWFPFLFRSFLSHGNNTQEIDRRIADSLLVLLNKNQSTKKTHLDASETFLKKKKTKPFNPNNATPEELSNAGLPKFLTSRIIKFREKGGKFKIKKDLLKIYGFQQKDFDKVYAYIDLPETLEYLKPPIFKKVEKEKAIVLMNLNAADSIQLIKLKGIGSVFASRILKYKKKLGGFISKEQLKEVYGLDSTVLKEIHNNTFIEANFKPSKINLNQATYSVFLQHPYIGKKYATIIIQYRNQHGVFNKIEDLKNIKLIDTQTLEKISPYISIE